MTIWAFTPVTLNSDRINHYLSGRGSRATPLWTARFSGHADFDGGHARLVTWRIVKITRYYWLGIDIITHDRIEIEQPDIVIDEMQPEVVDYINP